MSFSDLPLDCKREILSYSHSNLRELSRLGSVDSTCYRISCQDQHWRRYLSNRFKPFSGLRRFEGTKTLIYSRAFPHLQPCNSEDATYKSEFIKQERWKSTIAVWNRRQEILRSENVQDIVFFLTRFLLPVFSMYAMAAICDTGFVPPPLLLFFWLLNLTPSMINLFQHFVSNLEASGDYIHALLPRTTMQAASFLNGVFYAMVFITSYASVAFKTPATIPFFFLGMQSVHQIYAMFPKAFLLGVLSFFYLVGLGMRIDGIVSHPNLLIPAGMIIGVIIMCVEPPFRNHQDRDFARLIGGMLILYLLGEIKLAGWPMFPWFIFASFIAIGINWKLAHDFDEINKKRRNKYSM